jgi:PAS domain S-box-containing protein
MGTCEGSDGVRGTAPARQVLAASCGEALLSSALDCLIVADASGTITLVNDTAARLFGYQLEELIGRNVSLLLPEPHAGRHDAYLDGYRRTGDRKFRGLPQKQLAKRRDGSTFPMEFIVTEVAIDEARHFVAICRDLSEIVKTQETLKYVNSLLDRRNQTQLDFIQGKPREHVFSDMLQLLLELSGSEYGFIGEFLCGEDGTLQVAWYATANAEWDEATQAYYGMRAGDMAMRNLNTLFGRAILEGCPVVVNDIPHDIEAQSLPPTHPPLCSFMGIPLFRSIELVGMVGLANRPNGYTADLIECLTPCLTMTTYLLEGYCNRRLRVQAEAALKESQQRLDMAVQGAQLGLWDWNVQTGAVYFTPSWASMLGYRLDEIEPHVRSWENLIHPDDLPRVMEALDRHLRDVTPFYRCEQRLRTKSGAWKWILDSGKVFERDAAGKPLRAVGTHLDLSELKQAQEALAASEARLRSIVQNTPAYILLLDAAGKILFLNRAPRGRRTSRFIGTTFHEFLPQGHFQRVWQAVKEVFASGSPRRLEAQGPGAPGPYRWYNMTLSPVKMDGQVVQATLIAYDITERIEAERALQAAKEYAENIIESSPYMIISVDRERRIVEFNHAAELTFGYRRREILGTPVDVLYDKPEEGIAVHNSSITASAYAGEVINRRRNGECFPSDLSTMVLRDESGAVVGVMGVSRDISEQKRIERKLAEVYMRLEKSHGDLLAILNQLRLGILMIDDRGMVAFASRTCQVMLGGEAAVGVHWRDACPFAEADKARLQEKFAPYGEHLGKIPVSMLAADGQTHYFEIEVRDDPRNPGAHILFLYDVSEVHRLRRQLQEKATFQDLVGKSDAMLSVFAEIVDFGGVDTTVLIEGETGTGKELVARAIHASSRRAGGPFVAVNCAGLSETLVASQLFGHRRGAFTGAIEHQTGLFEAADGGTIFLDEIGDIPLTIQTSLLRVLQEREITRIGESRPRKVDVRVIAATNRDLRQEVAKGAFRQDLLYRIRVASITLPPLRARREDIPLLVRAFLEKHAARTGFTIDDVESEAMTILLGYEWPGNVRELENAIESAAIRCRSGRLIADALPVELRAALHSAESITSELLDAKAIQKRQLLDALQQTGGNRAAAAKKLGIGRTTLYRRINELKRS